MQVGEPFNPRGLFRFLMVPDGIARCKELRSFDKLLYGKIAQHVGQNMKCWPSQMTLAEELGVGVTIIARSLACLEKHGFIRVARPCGLDKLFHKTTRYELLWHKVLEESLQSETESSERTLCALREPPCVRSTVRDSSLKDSHEDTSSLSGHGDGTKEIPSEEVNVPFQAIIKAYNDSIGPNEDTSKVISLTDARRRHILARWGEPLYRTNWQRLFKMRGESDHLCGRTKSEGHENFRGDFDWLHKNNANYVKVLEGKYRNRKRRAPGTMTKEEDDAAAAKAIREGKERKAYYDSFPKFHLPPGFTASDLGRTKSGGGDTPKPDGGSRGEQNTSG